MPTYDFTADDLIRVRDTDQQSWAKVAAVLGLGSPGAARRAYTALVAPHATSVLPGRQGAKLHPVDLTGMTLTQVRGAIAGRTIVVQRKDRTEEIPVAKVTSIKADTINFSDGTKSRSVKVDAVLGTR